MLNCHYILARKDRDVLLCIYIYIYLPVVVTDWNMFLQGFCKSSYRVRHKVCSATHTHQEGCSNHRTMLHEHKFTPKSSAIQLRNHEIVLIKFDIEIQRTHGRFSVSSKRHTLHPRYRLQRKQLQQYRNTRNLLQYHKHMHPLHMQNNTALGQPSE